MSLCRSLNGRQHNAALVIPSLPDRQTLEKHLPTSFALPEDILDLIGVDPLVNLQDWISSLDYERRKIWEACIMLKNLQSAFLESMFFLRFL